MQYCKFIKERGKDSLHIEFSSLAIINYSINYDLYEYIFDSAATGKIF